MCILDVSISLLFVSPLLHFTVEPQKIQVSMLLSLSILRIGPRWSIAMFGYMLPRPPHDHSAS